MEEILKGKIYTSRYNEELNELEVVRNFHIYKKGGTIYINAPFPVKYMKQLRMLLAYNNVYYTNIIIGNPYI